jgi:hypothetical protein
MGKKRVSGKWKDDIAKSAKQHIKTGKKILNKGMLSGGKAYKSYVAPTVGLFKSAGNVATKIGKVALRFPGTGLAASVAYSGAKALGKKYGRGLNYPEIRQFNKKGRKF